MKKDLCLNKRGKVVSKKVKFGRKEKLQTPSGMVESYSTCPKAARTYWICCLQKGNKVLQGCQGNLLQVNTLSLN